jgi:DNA repair exonuclease SbcCD ATPase subunit
MKIDSIQIKGFGLFNDLKEIEYSRGINLIYGSNEAGKSTILQFIIAMLFGLKEEGRQSRRWLSEHMKYRPWSLKGYGGKMIVATDDGARYSIVRDFSEEADSLRIFDDITGKELTDSFEMDKTKERSFARRITGLSRSFFLSSVCIRQLGSVIGDEDAKTIASYAQSLIDTGGSDITAAKAIEILMTEVDSIGKTERGKVFKKLKDRQEELKAALSRNSAQQEEIRKARENHSSKTEELKLLSAKLQEYRSVLLDGWIEKTEKKLKRIKDLNDENRGYSGDPGSEELLRDFKDEQKDSVIQIEIELAQKKDQLNRLKSQAAEINAELEKIHEKLASYKQFKDVSTEELEQFSLNERRWRDLREDHKNKSRQLKSEEFEDEQTTRRLRRVELVFSKLPPHIDQVYLNWERQLSEFKNSIMQENSVRQNLKKSLNSLKTRIALLYAVLCIFIYYLLSNAKMDKMIRLGSVGITGLLLIILAAMFFKKSGNIRKDAEHNRNIIKDLESQKAAVKEKIDILFETTESKTGDEFTAKYNSFINLVSGKRQAHQEHLKGDIRSLELRIKDLENEMLNLLERAFPGIRPDKISPEMTEQCIQEAKKYLELSEEELPVASALGVKKSEIEKLSVDIHGKEAELERIFRQSGVRNGAEYKSRLEDFNKYLKYRRNIEEISSLTDGGGIEKLQADLEAMKDERKNISGTETYPGGISEREAKEEGEALEQKSDKLKKETAEIEGRIKTMEENLDDREVLESELARVEEEDDEYKKYKDSLRIAMNQIEAVSTKMHTKLAPQITKISSDLINLITDGRYKTLKVDEALNITVSDGGAQAPIRAESLSQGTIDQVYLALRLALAQLFSESREILPVILDDSFTQYDDKRALQAMKALERLSTKHQILIFSCHKRDVENFSKVFKNARASRLIEL